MIFCEKKLFILFFRSLFKFALGLIPGTKRPQPLLLPYINLILKSINKIGDIFEKKIIFD